MDNSVDHALLLPRPPEKLTLSEKFADAVAGGMGSWAFVGGHALAMAAWIAVNKTGIAPAIPQFDPNLILLNLVLSTEAALGAAFILMSQGRKTDIARKKRAHDLEVDISSDRKISALDKQLDELLSILSPEQLKKIKENTFDSEDEGPVYGPEEAPPKPSLRERFSDAVTRGMGSWKFVIGHTLFQAAWIALNCTNVIPWMPKFDPNLTLLNLFLSTEAAFAGAFILMSQNRQGEQDDKTMDHDLGVDINAGRKLQAMQQKMAAIMEILTPDQLRALAAAREAALATANANKKEEPAAATTTAAAPATPPSNDDTKAVPKPKAAQAGGPK
ncbi:MAG: DUF1003 domain-containing protein [Alphaproteobacteria bacterium]